MGVPCCRMSVAPGREWVARGHQWVADGSRAVAPGRGDVAAMLPGVARLSPECRGLRGDEEMTSNWKWGAVITCNYSCNYRGVITGANYM